MAAQRQRPDNVRMFKSFQHVTAHKQIFLPVLKACDNVAALVSFVTVTGFR